MASSVWDEKRTADPPLNQVQLDESSVHGMRHSQMGIGLLWDALGGHAQSETLALLLSKQPSGLKKLSR